MQLRSCAAAQLLGLSEAGLNGVFSNTLTWLALALVTWGKYIKVCQIQPCQARPRRTLLSTRLMPVGEGSAKRI